MNLVYTGADTEILLEKLHRYRMSSALESCGTLRVTYGLMVSEIIAELGRRNDEVISRRDAEVTAMVGAATEIVGRRV